MLKMSINSTYKIMLILSFSRLCFVLGVIGLGSPDISDLFLIAIAIFAHKTISPYFELNPLKLRQYDSEISFIPLKAWLVPCGKEELTEYECKEAVEDIEYTPMGQAKLNEIKAQGKIFVYDMVNSKKKRPS